MPQNPFIVATKSPCADVFVFDMSKHPSVPSAGKGFCPEHHCTGHSKEGYGLSWNPHRTGQLLSGSDDAQICLWDVNEAGQSVPCVASWNGHLDVIEDVAWHQQCPTIFGSVGDDRRFLLWDARANHTERPMILVDHAHDDDINTLAFSPQNEFLAVCPGGLCLCVSVLPSVLQDLSSVGGRGACRARGCEAGSSQSRFRAGRRDRTSPLEIPRHVGAPQAEARCRPSTAHRQ